MIIEDTMMTTIERDTPRVDRTPAAENIETEIERGTDHHPIMMKAGVGVDPHIAQEESSRAKRSCLRIYPMR